MKIQLTLAPAEAKAVIAESIARRPDVRRALAAGKILLKGGTTVSAVAERLGAGPLRISGRITANGTKSAARRAAAAHSLLLERGAAADIDACFAQTAAQLGRQDIAVIGANALDRDGQAAILLGSPLGGSPGQSLAGLMSQGCKIIIACGLEKMIPGTVAAAVAACGLHAADWSMGMACGLAPLYGEVVTEQTALAALAGGASATVIAAGGILGGGGATTLILEGDPAGVDKAMRIVLRLKGAALAGHPDSLPECQKGGEGCAVHQQCAWRAAKGDQLTWPAK